ncbi:FemAB family XrtA/PEP-CTERM system-associated protein [Aurantiacibacter rhizosphaerae]|uniref:FemAB family PEP-CTERM system-associated protein n=1 Tax=Aurantiacibacter rhizosphaerae TaxID=2691582 RepID=A0A844XDX1_9SPHN|nr:FemAB family XrtA/PEP-CTERM system-associated protein [Aurantiacibacter rhizosphaerae]MWV27872.1 FemAB family PEP-CTERM system-associated protein [Aurantiacibacter rhizosphaerae]
MNAPFVHTRTTLRPANLRQPDELALLEGFVAELGGSVFHRPAWLLAVQEGAGQRALGLVAECAGRLTGWLPLTEVHSPIFGRALTSSGFAVEGGVLAEDAETARKLCDAVQEYALRLSCPTVELRGPAYGDDWQMREDSHCGFIAPLADDDDEQLKAIPRKQRAEVRKGLRNDLRVTMGNAALDRAAHYAVYAESVRNLGTPVFPKSLFAAVLDNLDADILTAWDGGKPVSSVLSLYHDGAVMPYWGGGTHAARHLRANDRMYYELMLHARRRGCDRFDFGRSKTGSGAYNFKKNWGFDPQPLSYASWTAPGHETRDADPTSAQHQSRIALWKKLPLALANRLGPLIARGLG